MRTKQLVRCALFASLTAAGAFIRVPVGGLIYTLQFLFAALAGVLLGAKWGALSQLLYVTLGLCGLPVFGGGGGLPYLLQPTCGFVLALPLSAWLIGHLRVHIVAACLAGLGVLYGIGFAYLALICNGYLGYGVALWPLAAAYVLPYLPGDALKICACALLCRKLPKGKFS